MCPSFPGSGCCGFSLELTAACGGVQGSREAVLTFPWGAAVIAGRLSMEPQLSLTFHLCRGDLGSPGLQASSSAVDSPKGQFYIGSCL